ncbi:TPA: fimbria/pilus periplasmic chaperone [Photobacterium damselae]
MKLLKCYVSNFILFYFVLYSSFSISAISTDKTRLVYDGHEQSESIKLRNNNKENKLVKVWVEDNLVESINTVGSKCFYVDKPIRVINGNNAEYFDIYKIDNKCNIPLDKESLFWLSYMEIPKKIKDESNHINITKRIRMKLLYRPVNIKGKVVDLFLNNNNIINRTNYNINIIMMSANNIQGDRVIISDKPFILKPNEKYKINIEVNDVFIQYINDDGFVKKVTVNSDE